MQPRFLADEMPAKSPANRYSHAGARTTKFLADDTTAKKPSGRRSHRFPRFLADEMLAKLVRFMRVMGIPVRYVEGLSDDRIMALARKGKYILLTSDEELVRRCTKRKIPALYIPQTPAEKQVALVVSHFRLSLPSFPSGTLCPKCGGKLLKAKKSGLKGEVYPAVLARRRLFWRCAGCSHIYWSGTHYERLRKAYGKIRRMTKS